MDKIKGFNLKVIIICLSFCLLITQASSEIESRIVGGTTTTIDKVPYVVQLLHNGRFFCGGTLVAPRYIVTAAHCVKGMRASRLSIAAGATSLSQRGVRAKVIKIMIPVGFKMSTMHMDVAVLKLQKPVKGKNIRTVGLCSKGWTPGTDVKVSGWGLPSEYANYVSRQVRTVDVKVVARARCQNLYRRAGNLTPSMFCAAIPGRKDACMGDSGGPAIIRGELCGVVSFGVGCARKAFPGVYTNVVFARNFIVNAMKK